MDVSDWDMAIADAEDRIKGLRKSIKIFQKHREAGDKWPGTEAGIAAESIPAYERYSVLSGALRNLSTSIVAFVSLSM
jgi:hypothetical protein